MYVSDIKKMQRKALSPDTSLFSRELEINFKPIKSLVLGQTLAKFPSFPALHSDRFILWSQRAQQSAQSYNSRDK